MSEFENPNLPENLPEKRIEVVTMRVGDIKTGFGNPRKIGKKKREELKRSLEQFGDFGLFLIDEQDNVIAGNMRHAILNEINPDQEVTCKRLVGYTEAELRAINIKDNTHAGEWDMDLLADWTADLNMDLGLDLQEGSPGERKIKEMELRIAKGFRLGITREQSDTIVRAYECMVHPDFYRSIGKNTQECIDGGVAVLCQIFGS